MPVSWRSDLTRHAAMASRLVLSGLKAGRAETSENRLRLDLKSGTWCSSPLLVERRERSLPTMLNASDRPVNGVELNTKTIAPQPNSPCARTLFSQVQPLSVAHRSTGPQLAMVSHAQEAVELGRQRSPDTRGPQCAGRARVQSANRTCNSREAQCAVCAYRRRQELEKPPSEWPLPFAPLATGGAIGPRV